MKILLVDDSKVIRFMMKNFILNFMPDTVFVEATNGKEGLKELHNNPDVSIVFLDVNMPVMSGEEMLEKVRKVKMYDTTSIVMATAKSEREEVMKFIHMGANGYVVKPMQEESIKKSILDILEKRAQG